MKVMLRDGDPKTTLRFIEEAQITAQLEHPNIVPVYELSVDDNGQPFYTMKLVQGITLKKVLELLKDGRAETIAKYGLGSLLTIFQKICDAVAFAHSKGVIHRDLKPANIMLGHYGEVMVMDWGLAKIVGSASSTNSGEPKLNGLVSARKEEGDSFSTMAGSVMGTPHYMSPEQARGETDSLDARSDIFTLGAILYEMLTLERPFTGRTASEILNKIVEGDCAYPGSRSKDKVSRVNLRHLPDRRVPDSLDAVVRKCMATARERRYQTVQELQDDITAYQNGFATSAEQKTAWKQLSLFVRRNRAVSISTAVGLSLLIGTSIFYSIHVTKERNRAEATLAQLRRTAPTFAAQAKALVEQGKLDEALEKIGFAIDLVPANADFLLIRANFLQASQRLDEAAREYERVLQQRVNDPAAKENLKLTRDLLVENGGAKPLSREVQGHLVGILLKQNRVLEAAPLAAVIGKNQEAVEAALLVKLREYTSQPQWHQQRLKRWATGGFDLDLTGLRLGDLAQLSQFPISGFEFGGQTMPDLKWTKGFKLNFLYLSGVRVSDPDLRPLQGLHLRVLSCNSIGVLDLAPLAGMSLERLYVSSNKITDLSPLRGMPLKILAAGWNYAIRDLSPLKGMALVELELQALSNLRDLSPLRGMPLKLLRLNDCYSQLDLTPLEACTDLEEITLPSHPQGLEVLRKLPKLKLINGRSANDYWLEAERAKVPPTK